MKNFWRGKKVLVTGGAGFIGSHAVDELVKKEATVTVVVSPNTDREKLNHNLKKSINKVTVQKGNLILFDECLRVVNGQEIILNFAAMDGGLKFKRNFSAEILRTNTLIALNLLEASRINKAERLLLISTIDVYPNNSKNPIKEDNLIFDSLNLETNGYIWSKRFLEIAAKEYCQQYGLKIAIARLGNIYGPRDSLKEEKERVIPLFLKRSLKKESITIWGDGKQKRSFLYVTDLIKALLLLVEKYSLCDPVNIAGEKPVTFKKLAQKIMSLTKNKTKIEYKEYSGSKPAGKIVDIKKAKKVISFDEKTSLDNGLKKTIIYFKKYYD